MGVPKFFWNISERYPCLSEFVTEFKLSGFDNLYLDMNGIIHSCSHPNDFDPHFSIDEEKIFASIFHYIEVLFNIVKPKKLFFMAVDGVAPRAKMNQQRARRFRSAKEVEMKEKEALEKGEKPLPKTRFDSNCITPGTVFMDHLHSQLKYFVSNKISTDPLWQNCKIILSGHQTPGEGEHKIMDYIRYLKTQPDYDENTRHCLYGLDADLIMLGMCTHEPHFSMLREKVKFTRQHNKRILSPDETDFYLLHLSLLREYLDLEFQELKQTLPFQYDLEHIIDDWVLMGFLVGNDFIPNLPDLHINQNAFPILYKAYKEVLPTLDGYLNENGYLNLPRFQKFMERMAQHDLATFEDTYANLMLLEEKTGKDFFEKKPNGDVRKSSELDELIKATDNLLVTSDEESPEDEAEEMDTFLWEFDQHKKNYYTNKLDYSKVTPEVLKSQAECYVRAIQWILHYYYHGCQSWSWFYPHHYAPYISDIKDFQDLKLEFEMGKPFLPFEQLLAVLPAASKNLLPEVYHHLMSSPNSPIIDFYPENFETDLNGKQQDWEAVVLIPFIDEKRLLEAMEPYNKALTSEEKRRNQQGPMHVYSYTKEDLGVYESVKYFCNIPSNHALVKDVSREEIAVPERCLKYGLRPGVLLDVLYPGFPTLKHIPHTASLKAAKVTVFEQPSRNESIILKLKEKECPPLNALVNLLGKTVYVNWPHLAKSRAVAVSDIKGRYYMTNDGRIEYEIFDQQKQIQWMGTAEDIVRRYTGRLGIELGKIEVIVHVLLLDGRKHSFGPMGKVTIENIWSTNLTAVAHQVVVHDIAVKDFLTGVNNQLKEAFPIGSVVFMLGHPHFGSMGRIIDNSECNESGRLKVELETVSDPVPQNLLTNPESKVVYLPCKVAALRVGISPRLLSRITGNIFVSLTNEPDIGRSRSKMNIGLNMKFHMKNEEIPGYTKRDNDWMYSHKVLEIVAAYVEKFSRVIEFLSANPEKNMFYVHDIFPGPDGIAEMNGLIAWVRQQEYNKVERVKSGTSFVDPEIISQLEEIIERAPKIIVKRQMQVKPHLLYKNDLVSGKVPPMKFAKHNLLDRVVSIRSSYTVPAGLRGFIVGIHPAPLESDYMYDILFDTPFLGGAKLHCSSEKGFRMSKASFLNVSDAYRYSQRSSLGSNSLGNLSLRPCYGEPKTSAFAQWTHPPSRPSRNEDFDEFKKMWSDLQTAKPQEDALKKILKIEKKEKEEDIVDPVKSFFEKVTKTQNESPRVPRNVAEGKQPNNRYYLQLFSYHGRHGLGEPTFKYHQVGGKVMAEVFLCGGKVYTGLPCDDKESACESASLQALGALGLIPLSNEVPFQKERERGRIMENQIQLLAPLMNPKGDSQNRVPQRSRRPAAEMPPLLPDPPSQWVGHGRNSGPQGFHTYPQREIARWKMDVQEKPQNVQNPVQKKQGVSALEFVPLQAITGKRNYGKIATIQSSKQGKETQKKAQVPTMSINNVGTSTSVAKPKRKPKIAAKLNLDPNLY